MSRLKEIGTAGLTLACALGIGFAMQSTNTADVRYGTQQPPAQDTADSPEPDVTVSKKTSDAIQDTSLKVIKPTTARVAPLLSMRSEEMPQMLQSADTDSAQTLLVRPETVETVSADVCPVEAEASLADAAFVDIALDAICRPGERVTIHHDSLVFTDITDENGRLNLRVPAMMSSAVFILAFEDGDGTVAQIKVPRVGAYKRVALQWTGDTGFELHAREFGADYGAQGHVWHGAEQSMSDLIGGTSGYMVRLGDGQSAKSKTVDVYSFPATMSGRNGQIDLSVEAVVGAANCDQQIEAVALDIGDGEEVQTATVTMAVPGCDTRGDYLVLNNIFEDLKIASR